jgi:AraC family transcriptional regulator, activator of mtrCDE
MHSGESIQARVSAVYHQLLQNPVGRYYINDLAKQAGLTPEVFNNSFKEMYGLTVPQCITQAKMQLAITMISEGHSIKQVSAALQYKQVINFHKTFKRVMGVTPKQYYRQNCKKA